MKNVFSDNGFRLNPFDPLGVTKDIDEDVPPPVGVQEQLIRMLKELEKSQNYKNNTIIFVVGEYGSGKSEILKYFYRYFKLQGEIVSYTHYNETKLSILKAIRNISILRRDEQKRTFIFLDEIDDIPRYLKERSITSQQVQDFCSDLRHFLENGGEFKNEKNISLILGLGFPSYSVIDETSPDITQHRLINNIITLHSPEPWQIQGFIRRSLVFYANEQLKEILKKVPYFPFSDGIVNSLANISALSHNSKSINARFIFQMFDRVIYDFCKNLLPGELRIEKQITFETIFDIIKNPKKIGINHELFNKNASNLAIEIDKSVTEAKKFLNLNVDQISRLYLFLIFNHILFRSTELGEFIAEREIDPIIERFIDNKTIEIVYVLKQGATLSKPDFEKSLKQFTQDDSDYKNLMNQIFEKTYDIELDIILSENKFDITKLPTKEYVETFVIPLALVEQFKTKKFWTQIAPSLEKKYRLTRHAWEDFLKNARLSSIEENQIEKLKREIKNWSYEAIQKGFQTEFVKFLKEQFDLKVIEDLVHQNIILLDNPLILIYFVKDFNYLEDLVSNNLKKISESNQVFEAILIFIPDLVLDSPKRYQEKTEYYINQYFYDVFKIPVFCEKLNENQIALMLCYGSLKNEITNLNNEKSRIFDIITSKKNDTIKYHTDHNRILLKTDTVGQKQVVNLKDSIKKLWNCLNEEDPDKKLIVYYTSEIRKLDSRFLFNKDDLLSNIERSILEIINSQFGMRNEIELNELETVFYQRYMKTFSRFTAENALELLEIKGLVEKVPKLKKKKKWSIKNSQYYSKNSIDQKYSELNRLVSSFETKKKIIFLTNEYSLNISDKTVLDLWSESEETVSELNRDILTIDPLINNIFTNFDAKSLQKLFENSKKIEINFQKLKALEDSINENKQAVKNDVENFQGIVKRIENFLNNSKELVEQQKQLISEKFGKAIELWNLGNIQDSLNTLNELIVELESGAQEIKKITTIRNFINEKIRDLPSIVSIIIKLNETIDSQIWKKVLTDDLFASKEFIEFQTKERFFDFEISNLLNEIPNKVNLAESYKSWIIPLIEEKNKNIQNILFEIKNNVIRKYEQFVNCANWLFQRTKNNTKWDKLDKDVLFKINEFHQYFTKEKDLMQNRIYLEAIILQETYKKLKSFEDFLLQLFSEDWDLIFNLVKNGINRAVNYDMVKDIIDIGKFDQIIKQLSVNGLFQTSIIT